MKNKKWYYEIYLKSDHWKNTRIKAREYFNNKCYFCGSDYRLEVHHLNYKNLWKEEFVKDIVLLCKECHQEQHPEYVVEITDRGQKSKKKFNELISYKNRKIFNDKYDLYCNSSKVKQVRIRKGMYNIPAPYLVWKIKEKFDYWENNTMENYAVVEYEEGDELYHSWEVFLCFIKYYKRKQLYYNLNSNIHWYFCNYYTKECIKESKEEDIKYNLNILQNEFEENIDLNNKIITLNKFRNTVPEEYLICWDDALLSMSKAFKDQHRTRGKIGMSDITYREFKKNYKITIASILESKI